MSIDDPVLSRRGSVETRQTKTGAILVDMNTGHCYRLNRVGAKLWAMLATPASASALCDRLGKEHGLSPSQSKIDVQRLVDQLVSANLISFGP
jgi:hypothetical protein